MLHTYNSTVRYIKKLELNNFLLIKSIPVSMRNVQRQIKTSLETIYTASQFLNIRVNSIKFMPPALHNEIG